ncbi:hypothetical protein DFH07DRAFT_785985, partial [Mycena maculata]
AGFEWKASESTPSLLDVRSIADLFRVTRSAIWIVTNTFSKSAFQRRSAAGDNLLPAKRQHIGQLQAAKAGSKRRSAAGDDLLPAKRQHIGQPQASTSRFQPATSTSTSALFTQVMRFRYIKGEIMSGEFEGHFRQFVGPSSKIHKAIQVYVETGDQVGNGKWIALPALYEPNIPQDEPTSVFYRSVLGLY